MSFEQGLRLVPESSGRDPADLKVEIEALADRARQGDSGAFEDLVAATYRRNYTLARRLTNNEDDARDVTQEAYLRAYRAIGSFRGESQFTTWMYRITANCASSHLGRNRRVLHVPLGHDDEFVDERADSDPSAHVEAMDLRERIGTELAGLPPKLRAVVVLRDVYELPHEVVAEELGISLSAAKVRLHRARSKLRSSLYPHLEEVDSRDV